MAAPGVTARVVDQEIVGVVVKNSHAFVGELLRCQRDGAVVVPLRSADDAERITAAGVTRVVEPSGRAEHGFRRHELPFAPAERVAQILFTSGTTGKPQGIVLRAGNVDNTTERLVRVMQLDSSVREYVGVPVYYSFGMGRVRAVSRAGGEVYLPANGFDPSELGSMLGSGEINALSAVPTLLRLLLDNRDFVAAHGRRLRWLEIGSQHMLRSEKEALKALFPNARIVQHYGLTEASRATFLEIHAREGSALESVGEPEAPVEVRLTEDQRIAIRGPHVARERIGPNGLEPLTDAGGWLVTNDLGAFERGLLHFRGRADDLVNCAGVKIAPEAFEHQLYAHFRLSEGLAVGKLPDPLRGEGLLVAYTAQTNLDDERVRRAANEALEAFGVKAAGAISVRRVQALPRTETGKIRRSALATEPVVAVSAANAAAPEPVAGAAATNESVVSATELEARLLGIWRETLGLEDVSVEDSFYDLGGDSLSAVVVALRMETAGIERQVARGIFEGKTIRALVAEMVPAAPAAVAATPGVPSLESSAGADDTRVSGTAPAVPLALPAERAPAPRTSAVAGSSKTTLAALNEASNLLRGIVLLAMISSHWIPVYLLESGPTLRRLSVYAHPFFSMGSPTLAIVFGLGVALFHTRQYARNRPAFFANVRTGVALLAGGIVVYACIEALSLLVRRQPLGGRELILSLYGPLVYYGLATASLPLWVHAVKEDDRTLWRVVYLSLALYFVYLASNKYLPAHTDSAAGEFALRVLKGKWGVPQMASLTAAGVALGIAIGRRSEQDPDLGRWLHPGLLLMGLGVLLSLSAGQFGLWFKFPKNSDLWSIVSYGGLLLALIGAYGRYVTRLRQNAVFRRGFELVCCLGVLLFPLFVAQSMVYHSSVIVMTLSGWSHTVALTVCIAAFAAAAAYPVRRVYKLYYS